LFESLKKKFSETTGKLRNKVEDEAKEENNLELVEEYVEEDLSDENHNLDEDSDDESGVDSDDLDNEESGVDDTFSEDLKDEIDDDTSDADASDEVSDSSSSDDVFSEDSDKKSEEKKSGFFSFLKRNKKESDDEKEEVEKDGGEVEEESDEDSDDALLDDGSVLTPESVSEVDSDKDLDGFEESEEADESDSEEKPKKSKRHFFSRKKDSDDKSEEEEDDGEESDEKPKKRGFLSFIKEKSISEKDVEDILFELELGLLEADVAMEVATTIVESVKNDLVGQKVKRGSDIDRFTENALKNAVSNIIDVEGKSMTEMLEEKVAIGEPLVVMFVGINGTGKTTTIGKLSNYYIKKGYTPVIAASDTFRAGAIEQVAYHADNLNVKLIKHEKGSDPAAVAFDAVQHAKAKGKELVLIDTAGRMQTNTNLMDEMKKIRRVSNPDLVVFVGDALTGNDATEQARKFNDAIDIDGVILTKADADSKGGASLSIGYVIKKPILFLGMGQSYDDIKEYDPDWMLEQIFS